MRKATMGRALCAVASVMLGVVIAAATGADGATTASSFQLAFDGSHNDALLHRGPFTTTAPFCPSGRAEDVSIDEETRTALRRFECAGAIGTFSVRVSPLQAEHGGAGVWQIIEGTGPLGELRGKGTWTSVRVDGTSADPATITFRSTWEGVADFDTVSPATAISSLSARALRRPVGTRLVRAVVSLADQGSNPVSYQLKLVDPRKPYSSLGLKTGTTNSPTVTIEFRVKPAKQVRTLRLEVAATDPVGNGATSTRTVRLNSQ